MHATGDGAVHARARDLQPQLELHAPVGVVLHTPATARCQRRHAQLRAKRTCKGFKTALALSLGNF
jgi:hypothetical protein